MIFLIRSNYPSGMIAGLILFIVLAIFVLGCYLIMKIPMTGNHPNAEAAAVPLLLVWLCLGWIVCISFWPYSWSNTGVFVIMIMLCLMLAVGLFVLLRFSYAQLTYVIRRDPNALAMWTYTPTEWQQAVADEFMWGLVHSNSAQIKICQLGFLVDDGSRRRVFHLETGTRVVTFAGYLPNEGSKLRLRVRWRMKLEHPYENETIYYKQDYRIPVPFREREQAQKVVNFFMTKFQNNVEAYAELFSDREFITLFGNDSF